MTTHSQTPLRRRVGKHGEGKGQRARGRLDGKGWSGKRAKACVLPLPLSNACPFRPCLPLLAPVRPLRHRLLTPLFPGGKGGAQGNKDGISVTYTTLASWVKDLYDQANVIITKVCHAFRGSSSRHLEAEGCGPSLTFSPAPSAPPCSAPPPPPWLATHDGCVRVPSAAIHNEQGLQRYWGLSNYLTPTPAFYLAARQPLTSLVSATGPLDQFTMRTS
jgi:hypothetical protein